MLGNFSLHLKKQDAAVRKEQGRKFLNYLNGQICRRKFTSKKSLTESSNHYLYEGLIFPFGIEDKVFSCLVDRDLTSDCQDHPL